MEEIAEKKKAIFESTLLLIRERGFHGTPMSMIAKNANVAAGTIYHYFCSKEELINELYFFYRKQVEALMDATLAKKISYKDKFFEIWIDLYNFYSANSDILVFFEQYINSPFNKEMSASLFHGKFYRFIKEGIKEGHLRDAKPEMFQALYLGSLISSAKLKPIANISLEQTDTNDLLEMIWKGISIQKS
jgi:AcrR family transcriptional regulator